MNVEALLLGMAVKALPRVQIHVSPPKLKFPEILSRAVNSVQKSLAQSQTGTPWLHTVRKGETLSQICLDALKQSGVQPTNHAIYDAVHKVAQANGIRNPNMIYPGQKIDLSVLSPSRAGSTSDARNPLKAIVDESARLTSRFGLREDPISGEWRLHRGIDLAASPGSPVHAVLPGRVTFSGWKNGYGNIVEVSHAGGLKTTYAHNARNLVHPGDKVTENTRLALLGSTGRATGPHVHFEVHRNGRAIDPLPFTRASSFQVAKTL